MVLVPVPRQRRQVRHVFRFLGLLLVGEEAFLHRRHFRRGVHTDPLGVRLVQLRHVLDDRVALGRGDRRVVHLRVPVTAVPDQVDHHIGPELRPVLRGDRRDAHHRVGVFRVDVEDRDRQALGNVGRKARRVRLLRNGREAQQVVDDHVDRAAHVVAVQRGHVERFGQDALPGEGRIAVDRDGQHLRFAVLAVRLDVQPRLLGARAAQADRVDRLQVARV